MDKMSPNYLMKLIELELHGQPFVKSIDALIGRIPILCYKLMWVNPSKYVYNPKI
jgi:hypothetical protein